MPADKHEDITWVQCDDLKCLKWRKVPGRILESIKGLPWYCHMNPDKTKSSCHSGQDPMKKPKGHQFVFSRLEEGSLVWAKLAGYPRYRTEVETNYIHRPTFVHPGPSGRQLCRGV